MIYCVTFPPPTAHWYTPLPCAPCCHTPPYLPSRHETHQPPETKHSPLKSVLLKKIYIHANPFIYPTNPIPTRQVQQGVPNEPILFYVVSLSYDSNERYYYSFLEHSMLHHTVPKVWQLADCQNSRQPVNNDRQPVKIQSVPTVFFTCQNSTQLVKQHATWITS